VSSLAERIDARARRTGPIRFDEFMELALYDEDGGFFSTGGGAGREGGDFLTSPEVGPLFGAVLANAIDAWWDAAGRPDPWTVVDAGAGTGRLAASVLTSRPRCEPALRYVLVERSAALRARHRAAVPVEPASLTRGAVESTDGEVHAAPGQGPVVTSLAELPSAPVAGVILANELLDNLPFRLFERSSTTWLEVLVGTGPDEVLVDVSRELGSRLASHAPDAPAGARVALQDASAKWVRTARASLEVGRLVVIDYATTTAEMARRPWTEWLRTYARHGRGGHPLARPGEQDITADVALDQLPGAPHAVTDQADFLRSHGIDDLVDAARQRWRERAAVGDLEALAARSRVHEADALTDPAGLGAFRVVEWAVSGPR
jgi:SAM-dependent MidA family methyltransferase